MTDVQVVGDELGRVLAAGRDAIGGEWEGAWEPAPLQCEDPALEQFSGIFQHVMPVDPDEAEDRLRSAWAEFSGDITRTDRPDGSSEVLIVRDDGLRAVMVVNQRAATLIGSSACFPETDDDDPRKHLPQSGEGVTFT